MGRFERPINIVHYLPGMSLKRIGFRTRESFTFVASTHVLGSFAIPIGGVSVRTYVKIVKYTFLSVCCWLHVCASSEQYFCKGALVLRTYSCMST